MSDTKPAPQAAADTSAGQVAPDTTEHDTPIPPPPRPAQGLSIILKPGLQRQSDLPESGGGGGGGAEGTTAPSFVEGATQDPEAAQAAAELMQQSQIPATGTQDAKVTPGEVAPAARTLRDIIMEQPSGNAAAAGTRPSAPNPLGVVGDIATGIAESPKAVVGGIRNAGQELLDSTKSVADWLNKNVGDLGGLQIINEQGQFDPKFSAAGTYQDTGHLPEVGKPRSVTGNVISNITQFMTGFAVGGKLLGAYADAARVGKVTSTFVRSAFSDAFAFNPAQERLSNLVQSVPELQNPVTAILAAHKDDSEAVGRLKNALEGLGVGAAMQAAFVTALRGMRAARAIGHAPPAVDPKQLAQSLSPMGDASATGPIVARTTAARDAAKAMTAAEAATARTTPQEMLRSNRGIKAFHGTPHEVDQFDVSRIGSGEGNQAYGHGLYFAESEDIARFYQQALSGKTQVFLNGHKLPKPDLKIPHADMTVEQLAVEMLTQSQTVQDAIASTRDLATRVTTLGRKRMVGLGDLAKAETYREVAQWLKERAGKLEIKANPGKVYEVRIDAAQSEMLDWDKPFSQQSPQVRAALEKIIGRAPSPEVLGGDLYESLSHDHATNSKEAAELLRKAGIKGIRYLDQGSRILSDGQKPTYNHVVFDHDDVHIVGRSNAEGKIEPVQGVPSSTLQPHVSINFARIESPDDVKAALQQAADLFSKDISAAQRGVQSLEETKALADGLGMEVGDLLSRRRAANGARTPFTAEEAVAARRLLTAAGTKLLELARTAASPNAGEIDLFNFRRMMATHYAIQQEVLGARTETARALSSWRVGAGSGEAQIRAIQQAMEASGGTKTAKDMATALAMLDANTTTPGSIAKAVRQGIAGRTVDAMREAYTAGLLSNPPTHLVNFLGNLMAAGQQIYERKVANIIGDAMGTHDGVTHGEASQAAYAFLSSQVDAFRLAWKTLRTGETTDLLGKVDVPHQAAISAETWGLRNNSMGGRTVDLLGRIFRTPMVLLSSSDQYFKTINYRMEVAARAVSQATGEGLQGKAFAQRVAELTNNPSEDLKVAAADQALYATFNNQIGWFGKAVMSVREGGGALNPSWIVLPFVRTPVNLARYAFERTPLAPLVGQWRADIAAGGRARDLALSKMATGTIVMGLVQSMAESGAITGKGPTDPGERANWLREGHQSYSFRMGDKWVSYSRDSTFGTIAGFAADMQDTLGRGDVAPDKVDEWQEVTAGGIAAVANTTLDKTFLSGIAGFMDMMSDPQRYAPSEIDRQMASFVPFTGALGGVTRAEDQTVRDARTPWDAVMAKIPGLAAQLIPRRDLWGQPVSRASGLGTTYDVLSPFQVTDANPSPIDAEMERLRTFPQAIGWKEGSFNGVAVDFSNFPQTLDHYRALAGNDYKHPAWNMGLKDFLDATVSGKGPMASVYNLYSDGPQGGKAAFIKQWVQRYREAAAQQVLADPKYAQFKAYYEDQKAAQRTLKQRIATQ